MSKNQEFVKFDKVDKSYDGKTLVVKDLNLDIAEGEFITMLGPSGSGKTTCLMMLAGFETPTNGEIYLDANPISNIPPHKRGIGMVFQNYALFPHMTVYENLAFPLKVRKIQKDEMEKIIGSISNTEITIIIEVSNIKYNLPPGHFQTVALQVDVQQLWLRVSTQEHHLPHPLLRKYVLMKSAHWYILIYHFLD